MTKIDFAPLIPELSCTDLQASLDFYTALLGFEVLYDRPEDGFAFLASGAAQIMLEQEHDAWATGVLERPYGRGLNFQIEVDDLQPLLDRLAQAGVALFEGPETTTYRIGDMHRTKREFLVQDPDGYLLRFAQVVNA